ncbi:MAG TPA: amidophosphoribosyltransferase, partial [Flavobacteriales bacterium]|nr:amidophosphoribosyltransferase [Flavobacteriales bacterium]
MSDAIKHECGLAFIRLRKPLAHYQQQHGSALYGLTKLYLLMEKQHNRGQDGAGVATIKLDPPPGTAFIDRERSTAKDAIQLIFGSIHRDIGAAIAAQPALAQDAEQLKHAAPYVGEVLLGHLRYATFGRDDNELLLIDKRG